MVHLFAIIFTKPKALLFLAFTTLPLKEWVWAFNAIEKKNKKYKKKYFNELCIYR